MIVVVVFVVVVVVVVVGNGEMAGLDGNVKNAANVLPVVVRWANNSTTSLIRVDAKARRISM